MFAVWQHTLYVLRLVLCPRPTLMKLAGFRFG
jgi:hypothetical protein